MKRLLLGMLVAVGLAAGALGYVTLAPSSTPQAEAGLVYKATNCWYGEACHITWTSGYGSYTQTWIGVTSWGQSIQQVNYSPWCGATNCFRTSLKMGDPNIRWIGVSINGSSYVSVAYSYCYPAPGDY